MSREVVLLVIILIMLGVVALVVARDRQQKRRLAQSSQQSWQQFVSWATTTPEAQLPPVLVRSYDAAQYGAENFQKEASVLATRGYRVASTSAMAGTGPGAMDIAAIGLLAFGQGGRRSLTVTYQR